MINNTEATISKWKTFNSLIDVFKQKIKLLLNSETIHVILIDNSIVQIFKNEGLGITQPIKIDGTTFFVAHENHRGSSNHVHARGIEEWKDVWFK